MKENTKANIARSSQDNVILFLINNKSLIILILLMVAAQIASGGLFFGTSNLFSVIRQTTVMCLLGRGFAVVLGAGNLDLSIGHMLGFLSVIYALTSLRYPIAVAILVTLAAGALCGIMNVVYVHVSSCRGSGRPYDGAH